MLVFIFLIIAHQTLNRMCKELSLLLAIDSYVRGYHEYNTIWEPVMGEELQCDRVTDNPHDPYAVSVLQRQIVGHVPHNISRACLVFLQSDRTIKCTITRSQRYSSDLPQGKMEIRTLLNLLHQR